VKKMIWIAISIAALGIVALGLLLGFRWITGRAMFEPGTVAARVEAAGETLDPASRTTEHWQVTSDVALAHESFGSGAEHVLFVHGGPGFPTRGRPRAIELLAESHRVHLFDQRGCGASTRPFDRAPEGSFCDRLVAIEAKLGLAEQIADLERIRRLLGRDRLVLVGHSFGALVAALYAAEFPDRVRALVLVSPAPLHVMPSDGDLFARVRDRLPSERRAAFDEYMRSYFDFTDAIALDERVLSERYGRFRSFYAEAAGLEPTANDGDAGGFMILATYASLGRRHDWRAALARITAPAIVLHGRADLVPEARTRDFAAAIAGAEVEVIGAGPFALDEAPDRVAAAVERALVRAP
jgi:proline iminopeptidase